jgi:acetyl-CoA carboxylase biotin carboxyl carrier protein
MPKKSAGRSGEAGGGGAWNLQEIRELMDVLDERQINEFEMEKGGVRIRIKRGISGELAPAGLFTNHHTPAWSAPPPSESSASGAASVKSPAAESTESQEDLHLVKSPIVGTYYGAPSPSAPPFVKVGDEVQVGQPLCIIEAMKLMNEIESDATGEIVRVYVENGQPVEYGQSLFAIKPSRKK